MQALSMSAKGAADTIGIGRTKVANALFSALSGMFCGL